MWTGPPYPVQEAFPAEYAELGEGLVWVKSDHIMPGCQSAEAAAEAELSWGPTNWNATASRTDP